MPQSHFTDDDRKLLTTLSLQVQTTQARVDDIYAFASRAMWLVLSSVILGGGGLLLKYGSQLFK